MLYQEMTSVVLNIISLVYKQPNLLIFRFFMQKSLLYE
jgi:hypothetical protein